MSHVTAICYTYICSEISRVAFACTCWWYRSHCMSMRWPWILACVTWGKSKPKIPSSQPFFFANSRSFKTAVKTRNPRAVILLPVLCTLRSFVSYFSGEGRGRLWMLCLILHGRYERWDQLSELLHCKSSVVLLASHLSMELSLYPKALSSFSSYTASFELR